MDTLRVIISGGFSRAYHILLPEFERNSGISVTTLSGASQGTGPRTIRYQLEQGAEIDLAILSGEGLSELISLGYILEGSGRGIASTPLGAAVQHGNGKPDIGTVDAFKRALLDARLVVMPGSTSGLYLRDEVFPALGISDDVASRLMPRGTDSTALLAAGKADLALGPVSELVDQPGVDLVGALPAEVQLVQTFTAAIISSSTRVHQARKLIDFLCSERANEAIESSGMTPART